MRKICFIPTLVHITVGIVLSLSCLALEQDDICVAAGNNSTVLFLADKAGSNIQSGGVAEPAQKLYVGDLDGFGRNLKRKNRWQAEVTITVLDSSGDLVEGATVDGRWSPNSLHPFSASCITDESGQCSVESRRISGSKTEVSFAIEDVGHPILKYQPQSNQDPDNDHSDGTVITVQKPPQKKKRKK